MKNTSLLFPTIFLLAACTPDYEDLNAWMAQTRKEAKSNIIPFKPTVLTPAAAYTPSDYHGLNAFDFRRLGNTAAGSNAPDPNRPKEILEGFGLENMRFVGRLQNGSRVSGFIEANGHVYTVYPGNHIGQNYGRIQKITEDKIILTELVEDGSGNWIYRNAELAAAGQQDGAAKDNPTEKTTDAPEVSDGQSAPVQN